MTNHRARLLDRLRARTERMASHVGELVGAESPSADGVALAQCAAVLAELAQRVTAADVEVAEPAGLPVVRVGPENAPVVVLGHLDTVHPMGTLAEVPFRRASGRLYGPGCFDMKAGIVQVLHALSVIDDPAAACLVVTADEEVGSPSSRAMIERLARGATAVLVCEPAMGNRVKIARKGVSIYRLEFTGRAAHAGLEPERGANACLAMARAALAAAAFANRVDGTTVTPTVASAGSTPNTVPDTAVLTIDSRAVTSAEQQRVDAALRAMPDADGVRMAVHGGINRPPLPSRASAGLLALARRACVDLGVEPVAGDHAGGGSDGNFAAAVGAAVLDGLGAVGGGAHTRREWVAESALAERAALLARLIELAAAPDAPRSGPDHAPRESTEVRAGEESAP